MFLLDVWMILIKRFLCWRVNKHLIILDDVVGTYLEEKWTMNDHLFKVTYNKRPEMKWDTQQKSSPFPLKRNFFYWVSVFVFGHLLYVMALVLIPLESWKRMYVFECFLRKYSFCCSSTLHRGQSLHILSWMSLWWTSFARILLLSQFIWVDWWAISITLDSWIDVRHRIKVCPGFFWLKKNIWHPISI